ncbi:hypothetical protein ACNOYE_01115 [Nannocystaceae bacterium ST9]
MRRPSAAIDLPAIGLYAALASALVLVTLLGVAPLALALGLLALLVVD